MLNSKVSTGELKQQWREYIKRVFDGYQEGILTQWSRIIGERLLESKTFKNAVQIMFYGSIGKEVETWSIIRKAIEEGKKVSLPRIDKEGMLKSYRITDSSSQLNVENNNYGISEPDPSKCDLQSLEDIELIVVPGIAFDRNGKRLGRGKGYYDNFLKTLPDHTIRIGLGFSFQIFPLLPFDDLHDEPLQILLSEAECITVDSNRAL